MPRPIDACPYRTRLDSTTARCGLIERLTSCNPHDLPLCGVSDATCTACAAEFVPSAVEWNPVIASLVYRASTVLAARGQATRAAGLRALALVNIPTDGDLLARPLAQPLASVADLPALIPPPRRRCGPPVRRWSLGVTTAPRGEPTLEPCLRSLVAAGWPEARLFVDGGTAELPEPFGAWPRTVRTPRMGAWPSYYLALAELLLRDPEADAYLLVQDDTQFFAHPGLRAYLEEAVLWPGRRPGVVSLFGSRAYTTDVAGWTRFRGVWIWCALAFIFPRDVARRFVADADVVGHRWTTERNPLADIDWRVGRWARDRRVPLHFPSPSLVQHIGEVSALWTGVRLLGNRRAGWFAGAPRSGPLPHSGDSAPGVAGGA
jgi:hypothetical protein